MQSGLIEAERGVRRSGHVYLLGAGFSRAISPHLPLTDELGNEVLRELREVAAERWIPRKFLGGTFESWLSGVAEDQPDLSEAENLERRALFSRAVHLIHAVVSDRERRALGDGPPPWLRRLVRLMHATCSSVVTFNYDTLLEHAIDEADLYDWSTHMDTPIRAGLRDLPPAFAEAPYLGDWPNSLQLLKLHGSTNFHWVPGDMTGATVTRSALVGRWGERTSAAGAARPRLPGREPFLIPPASAKSAYYRNPIGREMWREAAAALEQAERLTVIGYSLPLTDLSVAGLLQRHLNLDRVRVDIVDSIPADVAQRFVDLGLPDAQVATYGGPAAVEDFITQESVRQSEQFALSLATSVVSPAEAQAPMLVGWREGMCLAVADVVAADGVIELVPDADAMSLNVATLARHDLRQTSLPTLSTLLGHLGNGPHRVAIRASIRPSCLIVGRNTHQVDVGYGDGFWNVLVPDS